MSSPNEYIITGGKIGKDRLKILGDVLYPYTRNLLLNNGLQPGHTLLDVGCGGGDVSRIAAALTGNGQITAVDRDADLIGLNRRENTCPNINYTVLDALDISYDGNFDFAYSRFLLTHLREPLQVLKKLAHAVKPGGKVIVEEIEFRGHFSFPRSDAFDQYIELFSTAAKLRGQNSDIGPALPGMFQEAGLTDVEFDVIQPAFRSGPGKWMAVITMENIRNAVLQHQLATPEEIAALLADLTTFTEEPGTIISLPRIFRVSGIKQ